MPALRWKPRTANRRIDYEMIEVIDKYKENARNQGRPISSVDSSRELARMYKELIIDGSKEVRNTYGLSNKKN